MIAEVAELTAVVLTILSALYGQYAYQRLTTFGAFKRGANIHGLELKLIPGTVACEDLHYDPPSGQLYTACQGDLQRRSDWFPPLLRFEYPASKVQGSIVLIDPETFRAKELQFSDFESPFQPHGIEILTDPLDAEATFIFAVSHLSNPDYYEASPPTSEVKGLERIEVFRHVHGEDSVTHVRSVQHPLIRTANDIAAISSNSFYVTNDHHYIEGYMRALEDIGDRGTAPWSTTIFVEFDPNEKDPSAGVKAEVALTGLHNNNGLGHGHREHNEINIVDATGGVLYRATPHVGNNSLQILESIQLDSTLDNPFYYNDVYATEDNDASGYIVSGLGRAYTVASDIKDPKTDVPSIAWHVRSNGNKVDIQRDNNTWEKRLVFQDDGKTLRSASGAVLLGIDPAKNDGKKQGWLFVTGFASKAAAAVKIDL